MDYKTLIEQTKPLYDKWNEILKNDVHFFLPPTSLHTYGHCDRVLKYGLVIGKEEGLTDDQMQSLAVSCIFHDCGRKDDYVDFQHGERSAQKYKVYCLTHELEFDNRSYLAIFYHNLSDDEGIRAFEKNGLKDDICVLNILKDADALDRFRISDNNLDKKMLRTETAKDEQMIARAYIYNKYNRIHSTR